MSRRSLWGGGWGQTLMPGSVLTKKGIDLHVFILNFVILCTTCSPVDLSMHRN